MFFISSNTFNESLFIFWIPVFFWNTNFCRLLFIRVIFVGQKLQVIYLFITLTIIFLITRDSDWENEQVNAMYFHERNLALELCDIGQFKNNWCVWL